MYMEGIDNAGIYRCYKKSEEKPIVILKLVEANWVQEQPHPYGSLAGSDALYDAAFEQAGILGRYYEELLDTARQSLCNHYQRIE